MSNKPSVSPQQQTRADTEAAPNRDQIQERAYYRYVERGRAEPTSPRPLAAGSPVSTPQPTHNLQRPRLVLRQ